MLDRFLRRLAGLDESSATAARPVQEPRMAGPDPGFSGQVNWRAAGRAQRACCCPAQPVIIAVVPPAPGRVRAVDVLLCAHHYRLSRDALATAGAALLHISGHPVTTDAWPEIWAT
jgi:hypothetical protein